MNSSTILIVDDTPGNLGMAVSLLEGRGYRVAIAQDGEEGLQRAEILKPDLILLDVMMVGIDGFETCARLKALEATRGIPVIFMTALTSTEDKVKGFAAGGVDYVTKPLQIDEVLARVDTHIKLHAAHQQLEAQHAQLQLYHEELERQVAQRTLELRVANQQLQVEVEERILAERALEASHVQLRSLAARYQENNEEERKLAAHELHEDLAQILTGLQLKLGILSSQYGAEVPSLGKQLEDVRKLTANAVAIVRNTSVMLRPSVLNIGVPATLEWLATQFYARTNTECFVHIHGSEAEFSERQAIALFRIAQECLDNVIRHAHASQVDITLDQDAEHIVLTIQDNGCGFDTSLKVGDSLGLLGIRERALTLGGTVGIESSVGHGTKVVVRLNRSPVGSL